MDDFSLKEILNFIDIAIIISDNSGKILHFNKEADSLFNFTQSGITNIIDIDVKGEHSKNLGKELMVLIDERGGNEIVNYIRDNISFKVKVDEIHGKGLSFYCIQLSQHVVAIDIDKAKSFDKVSNKFLSNISHEIRTPLNGIIGFAELLLKKNIVPEKQKEFAGIIYKNGTYLLKLITDMLDLSRIEAGKLKLYKVQFSVNRLLYDLQLFFLLDMKNRDKGHIMFKILPGLPDGMDMVLADELRIKQVIINLVANAIKFTSKGEIVLGYKLVSPELLEFFVRDTGVGMDEEGVKNIFGRFQQATDTITQEYGGSGLGLSISKEFVELHGGKIWVESVRGEGSVFHFTLPLRQ